MAKVPKQVEQFSAALQRLPGVYSVDSSVQSLQGLTADDLGLAAFAQLPHAALRRTSGGREGEVYVRFEFRLEPVPAAWQTLEFLAWFVRDQARGGLAIQLRPFGLPPTTPEGAQLGQSLRFDIDLFCVVSSGSLAPVLAEVGEVAKQLVLLSDLYDAALRKAGHPGLLRQPVKGKKQKRPKP
jgi:hypothetical protein